MGWASLEVQKQWWTVQKRDNVPPSPLHALCSHQNHQPLLVLIPNSLYGSWGPRDEEGVGPLFSKYSRSNRKSKTHEKINKNVRQQHDNADEFKGRQRVGGAAEEGVMEFSVY